MPQDNYTETAIVILTLTLLGIGTLAMLVRAVLRRRDTLAFVGRQALADVKRGEGFTFHHASTPPTGQLSMRQWLDLVNKRPDQVPHLFIEGGSGAGKTTLATAILHDRPGPVAVVGVKPDDGWGMGYVFRSTEREAYLSALLGEVRRRLDEGDKSGLTIVLDDFTRLTQHKVAVELYKEVADVGRSLRIRLILIARGRLVKGIGASGESDLLEHFVFLTVRRDHSVLLDFEGEVRAINTSLVRTSAKPLPADRWLTLSTVSEDAHADLARLLGLENEVVQLGTLPVPEDVPEDVPQGVPATLTPEDIRTLYNAYGSKNKVAARLTGTKAKRLAIIEAALQETEAAKVA